MDFYIGNWNFPLPVKEERKEGTKVTRHFCRIDLFIEIYLYISTITLNA